MIEVDYAHGILIDFEDAIARITVRRWLKARSNHVVVNNLLAGVVGSSKETQVVVVCMPIELPANDVIKSLDKQVKAVSPFVDVVLWGNVPDNVHELLVFLCLNEFFP